MTICNVKTTQAICQPILLFSTVRKMDDYEANDMLYGDISQERLQNHYKLRDISLHLNPFTYPDRKYSARILFDNFCYLSRMFSFFGDYQPLIKDLISHMENGKGEKFTSTLLDKALEEHSSLSSSLENIRLTIIENADWNNGYYPQINFDKILISIKDSILPKFNNWTDRINGLTISIHDTWATHITLESLEISGDHFKAKIHYRIQDHFGLDDNDIMNSAYRQFRIFRIWFILQRWEGYGYKPFITEMSTTVTIEGSRFDKKK